MLLNLHVKNLALIDEIEVEFAPGLNILTGETGAGKSVLLGSMQMVLGAKVSREMIREGADYALVELLFQVENPGAVKALAAQDIELDDGQVLLSRKVMGNRSVGRINGRTCTMSQLKEAASLLLDIHGQHEHQSLLYPKKQLEILDAYGGEKIQKLSVAVENAYQAYRKILRELKALDMDEAQRKREMDFLAFEAKEIAQADLKAGEDEELEYRYSRMNNSRQILEGLHGAYSCTGYEEDGAGEQVGQALHALSQAAAVDTGLGQLEEMLQDIDGLLNDFNRELSSYMDAMHFEEEEFYQVEKRLDAINTLKAKYGKSIQEVLAYGAAQRKKLEKLETFEEQLEKLQKERAAKEKELVQTSNELSKIRKSYGKALEKEIVCGLQELNFLDVDFSIVFEKTNTYTVRGFDKVEYRISTNPGEPKKPFGKVVSGGELSRIMLAVKALLADKDEIETLIFDEIDTGISGRTAQKVSEKMNLIGRCRQVLCITHLPQIAAMADAHYEIRKEVENGQTLTRIYPLDENASIKELARMLGGAEITPRVLDSAGEMKDLAQVHKNARLKS